MQNNENILGLSSFSSLFNSCPGCTLVVLASLRATAYIPQPFSHRMHVNKEKQYKKENCFRVKRF
ncbi:MAG TPA: hypothetical protein VIQ00_10815 [Chitinophagaceae bacterium]